MNLARFIAIIGLFCCYIANSNAASPKTVETQAKVINSVIKNGAQIIYFGVPLEIENAAKRGPILSATAVREILSEQKKRVISRAGIKVLFDYEYLGVALIERLTVEKMQSVEADQEVFAVDEPPFFQANLSATESSNQLQAGIAQNAGFSGQGTAVLVTDGGLATGFNNHPDFGVCTAPGQPAATCQMAVYQDLDGTAGQTSAHGTNVAAIIARTARSTRIHFYDVGCGGLCINGSLAMNALNSAIANTGTLNFVAHNMSWGSPPGVDCARFDSTFAPAVAAGITQVASSGNDSNVTAIGSPGCSQYVVSVGSANTSPAGSVPSTWTPSSFSNVSPQLDFVAPGSSINAGGYPMSGTSQASPHVAGAFAVLRAANAWGNQPPNYVEAIMKNSGASFLDTRVGITFKVPQLFRASPRELRISNTLNVAYNVSPVGISCGDGCFKFPEVEIVLTLPPGFLFPGCRRTSLTTCTFILDKQKSGRIISAATLINLLPSNITVVADTILKTGFE